MASDRPLSIAPSPVGRRRTPAVETVWVRLFPFLATLRGYGAAQLRPDFIAGLTTALFAVPQAMAYALIAGFPPAAGIATTIIAVILGAAFGSSEFLMNGPTNAISVMLAANAVLFADHGIEGIVTLTLLVGLMQLGASLLRVGTLSRFVSEPVLTGFTAGAGVYIVINQLPSFLGIPKSSIPPALWDLIKYRSALFDLLRLGHALEHIHVPTTLLALLTFAIVRVVQHFEPRIGRRLPAPFFAVVLITLLVWILGFSHPELVAKVRLVRNIEPLTRSLPSLRVPHVELESIRALVGPALAIAIMGAVEAIAIGKSLALRAHHPFDASRQLLGEALCNLGAASVGGFASSGSFSRTMVNFESGAVTRMSCIMSGLMVLALVLLFAPLANVIPIAALAGTLVHIGLKLIDVARLKVMIGTTSGDRVVLLTTFFGVLVAEHLETALFVGIAVSLYYALRRAEGFKLRVLHEGGDGSLSELPNEAAEPREVTVLNLQGELFFAAAEELQAELMRLLDASARILVLRVQEAYNMDATTAHAIANVAGHAQRRGGRLLLCGVRPGMYGTFERSGLLKAIGEDAVFPAERELLASTHKAIQYAHSLTQQSAP